MRKDKNKRAVKEIRRFFNSPEFLLQEEFLLEFNAQGELAVRGCIDVNEYTEENILLVSEVYYINVRGNNLYMKQFAQKDTVIGGTIESIKFIKR